MPLEPTGAVHPLPADSPADPPAHPHPDPMIRNLAETYAELLTEVFDEHFLPDDLAFDQDHSGWATFTLRGERLRIRYTGADPGPQIWLVNDEGPVTQICSREDFQSVAQTIAPALLEPGDPRLVGPR